MTSYVRSHFDEEARDGIAAAIRDHLSAKGISRKALERIDLSKSTIDKALTGDFSDATLAKIESILGRPFSSKGNPREKREARGISRAYPKEVGAQFEGDYLCIRPHFGDEQAILRYIVRVRWSDDRETLEFVEQERPDAKTSKSGFVHIPFGKPFLNFTTISTSGVRLIVVSQPDDDGISKGILTTLNNPKGTTFIPVSAPVVMHRIEDGSAPDLGMVELGSPSYDADKALLASVISDDFGQLVSCPS